MIQWYGDTRRVHARWYKYQANKKSFVTRGMCRWHALVPDCRCGSLLLVEHLAHPKCPSKALSEELLLAWSACDSDSWLCPRQHAKVRDDEMEGSLTSTRRIVHNLHPVVSSPDLIMPSRPEAPFTLLARSRLAEICAGHSWASRASALCWVSSESKSYSDTLDACSTSYHEVTQCDLIAKLLRYKGLDCKKKSWQSPWSTQGELCGCCCLASLLTFQWHSIHINTCWINLDPFGLVIAAWLMWGFVSSKWVREISVIPWISSFGVCPWISSFGVTSENWTLH